MRRQHRTHWILLHLADAILVVLVLAVLWILVSAVTV